MSYSSTIYSPKVHCPSLFGLLRRLLLRGDEIYIERGLLVIQPATGKPVPLEWLEVHSVELVRQILCATKQEAYRYHNYKTGFYGRNKAAGLTLQFEAITTQAEAYSIFNVDLTRVRDTRAGKKGSVLPAGQFRTRSGSHLNKLWKSSGLPLRRLAAMHDYMGKLRSIMFSGMPTEGRADGRLDAGTLCALNISAQLIWQAVLLDTTRTSPEQGADSGRTSVPDNEIVSIQQLRDLQPVSGACEEHHGKTLTSESDYTVLPIPSRKMPQEQTVDEWLADYSSPITYL